MFGGVGIGQCFFEAFNHGWKLPSGEVEYFVLGEQ
jgi:hypothetical protein